VETSRRRSLLAIAFAVALTACATRDGPILARSGQVAGIEGEPIRLDAPDLDPKYRDYFIRVAGIIKAKWSYPCDKAESGRCDYKATQVVIDFGILKDGTVPYVIVREPSEFAVYNERAVKAIKDAAPFPPVPPLLVGENAGLPIRVAFKYVLIGGNGTQ
jgi:TonB family protein